MNNIVPFNIALSEFNGLQQFHVSRFHTGLNRLQISISDNSSIITVPTLKFDLLYKNFNIKKIDLLKFDVEGAELLILNGMLNCLSEKIIEKIIIEITPSFLSQFGHTKNQIYNLLESFGYKSTLNLNTWQYDEVFILN